MTARPKWLWLALGLTMLTLGGAKPADAATAYSRVKPLTEYTTTNTFRVDYEAAGDAGTVVRVDLYASKDGAAYEMVSTVYDPTTPFYFTSTGRGDGRYSFYTIATLSTLDVESKAPAAEAYTNVDVTAPGAPVSAKVDINQQPSLTSNEVSGRDGSVEAGATVELYSNEGLTSMITSTKATSRGSFGVMTIGDVSVTPVWMTVRDAAGNRSLPIKLDNVTSYNGSLSQFSLKSTVGTEVTATFVAPADAKKFRVMYKHAGGAVWSVDYFTVGQNGTTITLTGLEAGRAYDVRIAPVNENMNVGRYSTGAVRTVGTPIDTVVLATEKPAVTATTSVVTSTPTVAASTEQSTTTATTSKTSETSSSKVTTPAASKDATVNEPAPANEEPQATNEEPATTDNSDQATDEQNGSATPWVILAILIVLAGIATGGYFYWFSGPEEVTTTVTPSSDKKSEEKTEEAPKEDDSDKRW